MAARLLCPAVEAIDTLMKLATGLLLSALLLLLPISAQEKSVGGELKDAAKATGRATKKTGKKVARGSKKVVNKAAEKTAEGAAKVKDKTDN